MDICTLNINSCSPVSPPSSITCSFTHSRMKKEKKTAWEAQWVGEWARRVTTKWRSGPTDSEVINQSEVSLDTNGTNKVNYLQHLHHLRFSGKAGDTDGQRRSIRVKVERSLDLFQKCECLFILFFLFYDFYFILFFLLSSVVLIF